MIEEILATPTIQADDGSSDSAAPIDLSGLPGAERPNTALAYLFPKTRERDVEIVGGSGDSTGIVVPAGLPWYVGPYRSKPTAPQHLHAPQQTSVDLIVARVGDGEFSSRPLRDPFVDTGSRDVSSSLSDGGTLTVDVETYDAEQIVYIAKSDGDFQVDVTHFDEPGQSGPSVTQDASGGTVTGGNADGQVVRSGGSSARVDLNDQTSDASDATATLLAKAV